MLGGPDTAAADGTGSRTDAAATAASGTTAAALAPRQAPMSVRRVSRSLRAQLILIVVTTMAVVLTVAQTIDVRLAERALELDMRERARLVLRTIDSLWGHVPANELDARLAAIIQGDREAEAITVFRVDGTEAVRDVRIDEGSEDPSHPAAPPNLSEFATTTGIVETTHTGSDGYERLDLSAPVRRGGRLAGVAQVEIRGTAVARLKNRLRWLSGVGVLSTIVLTSLILGIFLERRVARPMEALVRGMRRVESGDLGFRVAGEPGGEFGFLAGAFNRMVARIEDLTTGLENRVRAATQDLADKNHELQLANERLWHAQLEVGRSERLATLGQMAGTLAHELGTPLNSVLGYVQLLRRTNLQSDQAQKLEIIESQLRRMIDTMRSVLDRTRDVPVPSTPVQIDALVTEAVGLVSSQAASRNVTAHIDVPEGLPLVPGDAVGLRQVLLNLLTNAIDATEASGDIVVSARALPANGRHGRAVELAIRDTGHGMSPEQVRLAFEPFYTTKVDGRGTGLGLVIVDHIVRAHGGHLEVESTVGRGTTMRVRLPLEV